MSFAVPKDGLFFSLFCFFVFVVAYVFVFCFGFNPLYLFLGIAVFNLFEVEVSSSQNCFEVGGGFSQFLGMFILCFYFLFFSSLPFSISVFFYTPTADLYLKYFDSDVDGLFFKYLVYHSIIFLFAIFLASACAKAKKKTSRYCIFTVGMTVRDILVFTPISLISLMAIGFILSSNKSDFFDDEFWMPNYLRVILLSARLTLFSGLIFLGVIPIFILFFVLIKKVRGIFNVK